MSEREANNLALVALIVKHQEAAHRLFYLAKSRMEHNGVRDPTALSFEEQAIEEIARCRKLEEILDYARNRD